MAQFHMMLRKRKVHINATILSLKPIMFTIEIYDQATSKPLDWYLSRTELKKVVAAAAKTQARGDTRH